MTRLQIAALILGVAAIILPVLITWESPGSVSTPILLLIATLGGAVGGALLMPRGRAVLHLVGFVCGAIGGAGGFGLAAWWVADRSSIYKAELMLAGLIGALPGVILATVLHRSLSSASTAR